MSVVKHTLNAAVDVWLPFRRRRVRPALRLFCFPYAGGGASIFRHWANHLQESIEICAIQYPGRESRMQELPVTQVRPLVQELHEVLVDLTDLPFVVFGHSVGALIGFEFTRQLRRQGNHLPRGLVVSGSSAPHLSDHDPPIHSLPEPEFIEKLRVFEGTPPEILDNPEIRQLFLPTLRSDFALREHYIYEAEPPLSCPITAFGGDSDHEVSRSRLEAWREQTNDRFTVSMFSGGHFFLHTDRAFMLQHLQRELDGHLQTI